ncbi:glycosyltransferase family 4 protein [Compostimonas suwonensis]|uniref:Glycosyltransferase involved in cell wall biosynthesis n=1 Tax=Compostimonas suwonensis TaxID=1048394 RepID=A0A2M9BUZ1_9MICO|nr:glycosyltransferase family 1 protein [Compostimonas suwonensis]PJJ61757.1 glycosyltransferase involved in cell wall biosynthesis [Compostimonas suwonensis]
MTTLRVVVDQIVAPVPGGIGRYAAELTRELINTAPDGCDVAGIVSAQPQENYEALTRQLPGLARFEKAPFARRELSRAWQFGLPVTPGGGMIHAPSLLAPLRRHDRLSDGEQVTVTVHDVVPWTHPETMTPQNVGWHKAMLKRATKFADGIVVPTHAVADQLAHLADFGERVRVIGGAPASTLVEPSDADERAKALGLPQDYILTVASLEPRKGLTPLITALSLPDAPDLPLVVVGPPAWGELTVAQVVDELGLDASRVLVLGTISDADLAVALSRATMFVFPSLAEGFGLPIVEAFRFGVPVIHSDDPALVEVGGEAGLVVERDKPKGYPERLALAMSQLAGDTALSERLGVFGIDRARAFSWRDSAERVWQLHADM